MCIYLKSTHGRPATRQILEQINSSTEIRTESDTTRARYSWWRPKPIFRGPAKRPNKQRGIHARARPGCPGCVGNVNLWRVSGERIKHIMIWKYGARASKTNIYGRYGLCVEWEITASWSPEYVMISNGWNHLAKMWPKWRVPSIESGWFQDAEQVDCVDAGFTEGNCGYDKCITAQSEVGA